MKFILTWKDRSLPLGDEPYFLNLDRVLIGYFHTLYNIENNHLYSSYKANDFKIVDENYREFPKNILLKIQQSGLHPCVATALLNYQKSYNTIIEIQQNNSINKIVKELIRVSSDIFLCNYEDAIFVKMTYPQVILTDITYQVSILSECKDQYVNYIKERL